MHVPNMDDLDGAGERVGAAMTWKSISKSEA